MRIIVTNDGLKELNGSFELQPTTSNLNTINKSNLTLSKRSKSPDVLFANNKSIRSKKKNQSILSYNSLPDLTQLKLPKTILVKQTALSISDETKQLYSNDKETNQSIPIIKQGPDVLLSMHSSQSSSGLPRLKNSYSLKEIIPEICFNKLNFKLKKEHELYFHHTKLDEKRLRNERIEIKRNIFNEIERNKESTIDANNTNLIEYLTGKTTISDSFLKNLATYEEERISRLNQICKKISSKRERDRLYQEGIKNKIANQKMIAQFNYKKEVEVIESRMNLNKRILEAQKNYKKQRELQYKDAHTAFVRNNWERYNLERYYFSEPRKNKLCYQIKMLKSKD